MSTMISTLPSRGPQSDHYQTKKILKRTNPRPASSANPTSSTNLNRDMNNQHYQRNRDDLETQGPEPISSSEPLAGGTATEEVQILCQVPHRDDGSISEPAQRTGQTVLPGKKRKGRQPSKATSNRAASQLIAPSTPAPARSISTGNATKVTPGRPLGTPPKQAYAGPTFHASPAPSALPIPRFFSNSVPEAVSSNGLQTKMDESSSEGSESSPTPAIRQLAGQQQNREDSPLDFFFRADREEKAKARGSNPLSTPAQYMPSNGSTIDRLSPSPPMNAPSPHSKSNRRHSRHPTGGSVSDMFALDIDGGNTLTKAPIPPTANNSGDRAHAFRSNTAPSNMITQRSLAEDQRKAKTQALKNLLLSPQTQRPSSSSPHYGGPISELGETYNSLSPSPSSRGTHSSSHISSAPLPDSKKSYARRSHGSFPFLQDSLLATANGSPRPTARSSNLRREIAPTVTANPTKSPTELPGSLATGGTKQVKGPDTASTFRTNFITHGLNDSPQARPQSSRSLAARNGPGISNSPESKLDATEMKDMENDLRRILKMTTVDGAGVSGMVNGSSTSAASSENKPLSDGTRNGVSRF